MNISIYTFEVCNFSYIHHFFIVATIHRCLKFKYWYSLDGTLVIYSSFNHIK